MDNGADRRRYPRFDVRLKLKNFDLNVLGEIAATTRDISARGIGCVSDHGLPVGTNLDIWLYLPDGEAVHTDGTVVWSVPGTGTCQMGIRIVKEDIKPIPIVLRTLHLKSRYYS